MGPHPAMRGSTDSGTNGVNGVIGGNTSSGGGAGGFLISRSQCPITFTHLGRKGAGSLTLYSSSVPARRPWFDKIHDIQLLHDKRRALFAPMPAVKEQHFFVLTKINHMVTFSKLLSYRTRNILLNTHICITYLHIKTIIFIIHYFFLSYNYY